MAHYLLSGVAVLLLLFYNIFTSPGNSRGFLFVWTGIYGIAGIIGKEKTEITIEKEVKLKVLWFQISSLSSRRGIEGEVKMWRWSEIVIKQKTKKTSKNL